MPWSLFEEIKEKHDENDKLNKEREEKSAVAALLDNFPTIPIGHPDSMMSKESVPRRI